MENTMQESMPILASYLKSLTDINPTWHHQEDFREKSHLPKTFTDILNHEYSTTKDMEIQRSDSNEKPLFHEASNPSAHGPLKIEYSPTCGRYLVASRDITPGEVVFQEKPMVLTPKAGMGPTCLRCLRTLLPEDWDGCDGCGAPLCLPSCSGNGHSVDECRVVARLGLKESKNVALVKILNVLLTPLRTLLLLKDNKTVAEVVAALQSNKEIRRTLPIGRFIEDQVVGTLQLRMGLDVKSEIVHHICGVFDTNAFEVSMDDHRRGRALFPLSAIMNHSCMPNTQHWYKDGMMIVRAVTDIAAGESVTNTYTPMLLGTRGRASHLAATKLFRCTCKRCLDPMELGSHISSVACRSCKGVNHQALMVPPHDLKDDWKCQECGNSTSGTAVDAMIRAASSSVSRISADDVETLKLTLDHLRGMLGQRHYITLEIKHALINAIMHQPLQDVTEDNLSKVVHISLDLLEVASFIDPGCSRFRGMILLEKLRATTEQLMRRRGHNCRYSDVKGVDIDLNDGQTTTNKNKDERNTRKMRLGNPSSQEAKMLLSEAAECEFIMQYDPKVKEALEVTHLLRTLACDS